MYLLNKYEINLLKQFLLRLILENPIHVFFFFNVHSSLIWTYFLLLFLNVGIFNMLTKSQLRENISIQQQRAVNHRIVFCFQALKSPSLPRVIILVKKMGYLSHVSIHCIVFKWISYKNLHLKCINVEHFYYYCSQIQISWSFNAH